MISRLKMDAILLVDAVITGATGVLMLAGAWFLDDLLDLPTNLLWISGLILVLYAGFLVGVRDQGAISFPQVEAIVLINVGWGIGCLTVLVASWIDPNRLGIAFVLIQVVVVFAFATLQVGVARVDTRSGFQRLVTR